MALLRPLSIALFMAASSMPALAQAPSAERSAAAQNESAQLRVVGTGQARGAPDLARTTLTVLRTAPSAAEALNEANEAVADVTQALRDLGLEDRDLQTSGFSIQPQYRYHNDPEGNSRPPEIVGYEVRNGLSLNVRDLDRLGEILDRAVELGVNEGGDIRFEVEDPFALENEARRQAVERARQSAEVLAEAAGLSLGPIVSINDRPDTGGMPPRPMPMQARMMRAEAGSSVPVEIGESIVESQVEVVFVLDDQSRSAD